MSVVDILIEYSHFYALSHSYKESTVATTFKETILNLHGNLKIIVNDIDPIFTINISIYLFSYVGTQLAHNSSYHSQCNGKTEIMNKCLEGYLH
jgi:hypothetical protein